MTLIYKFQRDAEQAPAKGLMRVVLRQVLQAVDLCPDYDIFAEQIRQHSTMGLWGPSLDPREMTASQREIWQRYDARGVTAYPQLLKREVLYNNEHTLCIRDWLGPNARDMRGDIRVVDREVRAVNLLFHLLLPLPLRLLLRSHFVAVIVVDVLIDFAPGLLCKTRPQLSETLGGVWGSPSRRYYKILGGPPNTPV
jgi:hypothetical protein